MARVFENRQTHSLTFKYNQEERLRQREAKSKSHDSVTAEITKSVRKKQQSANNGLKD